MMRIPLLAGALTAVCMSAIAAGVTIGQGGHAVLPIRIAAPASLAEQTAVAELTHYLGRIIGTEPAVSTEEDGDTRPAIYVGPTTFVRSHGIDTTALAAEEWVIRSVSGSLILAGGRPRGTLYAVYRFLEDDLGVRWWNPWEEMVPEAPDLTVGDLDRRGKPVLPYRDVYMLYGNDDGRFAARNRLNRDGDRTIHARYGGCRDYGPPYHVHTFYMYFPPKQYFEEHPEYFSQISGERMADRHQLCLSNDELRRLFVEKLRAYIRASEKRAAAAHAPPPSVYDISQNDWEGQCRCDNCQTIVRREGSEAGLMLDFLNEIATRIAGEYPYVYIDTLAYQYTQKPPRKIKARDNVIVRLCDTRSNATLPITSRENAEFREFLQSWANVAKNLRIWDYAVTYEPPRGLPYPSEHTYAPDYRFYAENNVEGVFTEHEYTILADVRDFKVWTMLKLLENPYRDPDALAAEFANGFYGPAGSAFLEYRALLRSSQEECRAYIGMGPAPMAFKFLDLKTVLAAQALFARAASGVSADPVLSRRVRHARLSLDRATYVRARELHRQWRAMETGRPFPLDMDEATARVRRTWVEQADMRLAGGKREQSLQAMESELTRYTALPLIVELPERFRGEAPDTVYDFTADLTRNWRGIVCVVKDPEAESGIANRLSFPNKGGDDHAVEKYGFPMAWGLYVARTRTSLCSTKIDAKDISGPGYHWYSMGTHKIPASCYLYFFWTWIIQQDLALAVDVDRPDREFEVWARIKFTGPAFPHGSGDDANAIWVERVVLRAVPDGAD